MRIWLAAVLLSAVVAVFLVRNLMLGGWKDLGFVSRVTLPVALLCFSSSYLLFRGAQKKSKK
jgi:hypothetical protein